MTWEIVPEAGPSGRKFPWWIPLVVGIVVVLAGAGLMLWPFIAAKWVLALLLGSALIANGLALLVRARGAGLAAGVVLILGGVLAIAFAEFTANALVTFVGVAVILIGAFWLAIGVRAGGGAAAIGPAVLIMLAGVVALVWPSVALAFVAVIGGLFTLVIGASLIWTGLALRRRLGS